MNETTNGPKHSPWGAVQQCYDLGSDCYWVSTASHGGLKLSRTLQAAMPASMRKDGGWYEEDCDWALAVMVHPQLADTFDNPVTARGAAVDTVRNWHPHAYAEHRGVDVATLRGKSYKYDEECFQREYADKWIGVAAFGDWHDAVPAGFVGVVAAVGADRKPGRVVRYFLVTKERYDARDHFGYVIQDDDHPWAGPNGKRAATPAQAVAVLASRHTRVDYGDGPSDADPGL